MLTLVGRVHFVKMEVSYHSNPYYVEPAVERRQHQTNQAPPWIIYTSKVARDSIVFPNRRNIQQSQIALRQGYRNHEHWERSTYLQ